MADEKYPIYLTETQTNVIKDALAHVATTICEVDVFYQQEDYLEVWWLVEDFWDEHYSAAPPDGR